MAQNNSVFVFVRKTSSDSRERPNLRISMKQVTNLKPLGFTWEKYQIYWESPEVFDPHVSAIARFVVHNVANLVFVSVVLEADDSLAPTLYISLLLPPLPPSLILWDSLPNFYWTDGCWFSSIIPFATFTKFINDFTISVWAFSVFIILFTRGIHRLPAVFTLLTNWLLDTFVPRVYLQFH